MFEPGQKVIITETNFTSKTGPKVGSMGFVSGIDFYYCGVRFDKVTWFRYGLGKSRMETHTFYLIPGKESAKAFRARAWGKVKPIHDRQNINDMTDGEFLCWMHSTFRLLRGNRQADRIRAKFGITVGHLRPGLFRWNRAADRTIYAEAARQLKSIYFKEARKTAASYYQTCVANVTRTYDTHGGMRADTMAQLMILNNGPGYDSFMTFFYMATCLNFVGPKYLDFIREHEFLSAIYSLWKQEVKIFD